jgi:hypothetical protein
MPKTEQERLEIIQDLIDRLLYLPKEEMDIFIKILDNLFHDFPVHYEIVDGVRVYKLPK